MAYVFVDEEQEKGAETLKKAADITKEVARPFVRNAVNVGSLLLGTPGDIIRTVDTIVDPLVTFITGREGTPTEEIIPSSEQIKQSVRSLNPEYLSPQNKLEEFTDAVVEDAASLYLGRNLTKGKIPGANTLSQAQKLIRSFGISLGSNLAGTAVKDITTDDSKAGWAKFGTALFLSMLDKGNAGKYVGQAYKNSDALLPPDARHDASKMVAKISAIQRRASMGTLAPSEKFIVDEVDQILKRGQYVPGTGKATMNVNTAKNIKRSLGEKLAKFIYDNPKKEVNARAMKLGNGVVKALNEFLDDYGKTNPQWLDKFRQAEQGFATIATSNKVGNFIKNNLKGSLLTTGLLKVFGLPVAKLAVPATAAYPALQVGYRIAKSPLLRGYYGQVVKAAVTENAPLLNRAMYNLDKGLQRDIKKNPISTTSSAREKATQTTETTSQTPRYQFID